MFRPKSVLFAPADTDAPAVSSRLQPLGESDLEDIAPSVPAKKEEKAKDPRDKEIEDLKKRLGEVEASERHWSEQARKNRVSESPREVEEDAEEVSAPQPAARGIEPEVDLTPEQFLDILSKDGMKGLKKFGFLTKAEVDAQVAEIGKGLEAKFDAKLEARAQQVAVDQRLASEFPELVLVNGKPKDAEFFQAASKIFNEMVADDPSLKSSPATLFAAARSARKEIAMQKAADKQAARRERIDNQRGGSDRGGSHDEDSGPQMSDTQRKIVSELARWGATEEGFERIAAGQQRSKNGRG